MTFNAIALAATGVSFAEEEQDEYAVKVGYLYNFCNYVKWPSHVAPDRITVGVIGPALSVPDSASTIRELDGLSVASRKIVLREFRSIEQYRPCEMLFVTGGEAGKPDLLAKAVEITSKDPVLIVSESPDGLKRGSTINFVFVGKTIKLEINRAAAKKAKLIINAKLLRLAVNAEPD